MAQRNKKNRKPENRVKFLLRCSAPEFLTRYNEQQNQKVHNQCWQETKFQPELDCVKCEYLEVKKYG